MLVKMGGTAGNDADYDSRPKISYDGKWSNWYVEFYSGVPYWEARLYTSGILSAEEPYEFDVWALGGGANAAANASPYLAGRGATAQGTGLAIADQLAVTIGAAGTSFNGPGGATQVGTVQAAGGQPNVRTPGDCCRFSDPDKSGEAGQDRCQKNYSGEASDMWRAGQGGWLHWTNSDYLPAQAGEGYGAGGSYYSGGPTTTGGHPGVAVIRVQI